MAVLMFPGQRVSVYFQMAIRTSLLGEYLWAKKKKNPRCVVYGKHHQISTCDNSPNMSEHISSMRRIASIQRYHITVCPHT